jgi:hypothetical protein
MRLSIFIMGAAVLLAIGASLVWPVVQRRSLAQADAAELRATYDRWTEAGRPEGAKLAEFISGRRKDLVQTNRSFVIGQAQYVTVMAFTQPMQDNGGTLFITTNKVLIWLPPHGNPKPLR